MMKRNVCYEDNVTRKDGKGYRGDGGESNYLMMMMMMRRRRRRKRVMSNF